MSGSDKWCLDLRSWNIVLFLGAIQLHGCQNVASWRLEPACMPELKKSSSALCHKNCLIWEVCWCSTQLPLAIAYLLASYCLYYMCMCVCARSRARLCLLSRNNDIGALLHNLSEIRITFLVLQCQRRNTCLQTK